MTQRQDDQKATKSQFHNPYNFVPLGRELKGLLGQREPAGHDRYRHDLWSGRIEIEIKTETPLLIPDAARASHLRDVKDHKIYGVRKGPDGLPLLPATSLKGALRSAYEAVTNSRFGVFEKHDKPPARRMKGTTGAAMVPARVVEVLGGFAVELWKGTSEGWPKRSGSSFSIKNGDEPEHLYAAWLPRYEKRRGGVAHWAVKLNGVPPDHGEEVFCWLEAWEHTDKHFSYWMVREMARDRKSLPAKPAPNPAPPRNSHHQPHRPSDIRLARGFVFVSGQNTENKHDERVFFVEEGEDPATLFLSDKEQERLSSRWELLIQNYQKLHEKEIEVRGGEEHASDFIGPRPGKTAFSRHVFKKDELKLRPGTAFDCDQSKTPKTGTLCYALLKMAGDKVALNKAGEPEIEALYPVMISRDLGHVAPNDLLPAHLCPATNLNQLSTADRVFGWVNQQGAGAYKGQLRVHTIRCETADAIETFESPMPLAILGAPKEAQARFYVGKPDGRPMPSVTDPSREAYFEKGGNAAIAAKWNLRGRKVYPHQAATASKAAIDADYWDGAKALAEANNDPRECGAHATRIPARGAHYREYIRRRGKENGKETRNQDSQNRSITEWVRPGATFTAAIDVVNLNIGELGALLWLLDLPDGPGGEPSFHRLGGGKPLGFGSARISITHVNLRTGAAKAAQYRAFFGELDMRGLEGDDVYEGGRDRAEQLRRRALDRIKAEGIDFENLPYARAFLCAAQGYDDNWPTHYPRRSERPDPAGENFKWFGENESGRVERPRQDEYGRGERPRRRNGLQLSLPAINDSKGLQFDPTEPS